MNKLIFKVNGPKDGSFSSLLKAVTKIRCRLYLDVENGYVTVENVTDDLIDSVIDLINEYYELLGVEVDNLVDDVTHAEEEKVVVSVTEFSPESPEGREVPVEEYQAEANEKVEVVSVEEFPTEPVVREVEPQGPEDLIVKKIEFQNPAIETAINKLLKTAFWAMYKQNGSERDLVNYIWTTIREMSLKYTEPNIIEFSVGDIVDCYYGTHLPREINGGHVLGIVLDITLDKMVYIVPITKATENIDASCYITFYKDVDVDYYVDQYTGGTLLLDKARYMRAERLQSVVGKAHANFLAYLIDALPSTFDFKNNLPQSSEPTTECSVTETGAENTEDVESNESTEEPSAESCNTSNTNNAPSTLPKGQTAEDVLLEVVGEATKLIEVGGSVLTNTKVFLEAIGMPTDNAALNEAFIAATDIKKITYENIIAAICSSNAAANEDEVKASIKETFRNWVASKEELAQYNRLAITSLLKIFAKAVNG